MRPGHDQPWPTVILRSDESATPCGIVRHLAQRAAADRQHWQTPACARGSVPVASSRSAQTQPPSSSDDPVAHEWLSRDLAMRQGDSH